MDFTVGTKNVGTGESSLNQTDQGVQNKQIFLVDNFQVHWLGYGLKNSEDSIYFAYHRQVGGQLRFFYDIVDIPSDKKFTSDDLRTTAVFNIQIETEDDKKHIINFEREIFPGDFMSKNVDCEAYNETYSVTDPQIYSNIIN